MTSTPTATASAAALILIQGQYFQVLASITCIETIAVLSHEELYRVLTCNQTSGKTPGWQPLFPLWINTMVTGVCKLSLGTMSTLTTQPDTPDSPATVNPLLNLALSSL